jgi:hypothetical protein
MDSTDFSKSVRINVSRIEPELDDSFKLQTPTQKPLLKVEPQSQIETKPVEETVPEWQLRSQYSELAQSAPIYPEIDISRIRPAPDPQAFK